ncbi:MAG: hypothetical protein HC892_09985 [Saprospiraceae bacterium]|nr:hypothetical protein [Saprospiraceae bacterium]
MGKRPLFYVQLKFKYLNTIFDDGNNNEPFEFNSVEEVLNFFKTKDDSLYTILQLKNKPYKQVLLNNLQKNGK